MKPSTASEAALSEFGENTPLDPAVLDALRLVVREALCDAPSPRLALSISEACDALGVGWDFFDEHIAPELRMVRRGRRKLIPVAELERWLEAEADHTLPTNTGMRSPAARKRPANRAVRASRAPAGRRAA